jgi:hypothetical protein
LGSLKGVKLSKINIEESATLHIGEYDYLKDIIERTKLENWKPIKNNPPNCNILKLNQKLCGTQFGTLS